MKKTTRRLQPVDPKQLGEEEFMWRLDDALLSCDTSRVTDIKCHELLISADQDIRELQGPLENKVQNFETTICEELARTGENEAENTRKLLEDQVKRIDNQLENREREEAGARAKAKERDTRAGPTLFDAANEPALCYDEGAVANARQKNVRWKKRKRNIEREILEGRTEFAADTPYRPCGWNPSGSRPRPEMG